MARRRAPSGRVQTAYQCGWSLAVNLPDVGPIIRAFGYMPPELLTWWEADAYRRMPSAKWWATFWRGWKAGEHVRERR